MNGSPTAVVIPIRAFLLGKTRLGQALASAERAALMRQMADTVVNAVGAHPVVVVTSAPEVRHWARMRSLDHLDDPGSLDGAAVAGVNWAAARRIPRAVIAHADLPLARTFEHVTGAGQMVTAVPCRRDDGTTVLSVPTDAGFRFAYGPGSFRRHAAEARRLGTGFRVVRDPDLAHDVDGPADLLRLPVLSPVDSNRP